MTRILKRCVAVLILFVVGSTCVLATPSATRATSASGSAAGGYGFYATYDNSDVTSVEVNGSLTYYTGKTRTGWGTASDVMDNTFTISNLPNRDDGSEAGLWVVSIEGDMEITVFAENYQMGTGMYYSEAYASCSRFGPASVDDYSSSGTVYIFNEDTLQLANVYFSDSFTVQKNSFSMQYREFSSGQIITNRPEVAVKSISETSMPIGYASFATAYDSTDPSAPIYIHMFDLE